MKNIIYEKLPFELLDIIFSYLPNISKLRLNKNYYEKYHTIVRKIIKKGQCESYIRCMIRQDNNFIIRHLIKENYVRWTGMIDYYNGGLEFYNYIEFLTYYCDEYNSKKCEEEINEYIKKNIVGKNIVGCIIESESIF
jgi:hypothetical protein